MPPPHQRGSSSSGAFGYGGGGGGGDHRRLPPPHEDDLDINEIQLEACKLKREADNEDNVEAKCTKYLKVKVLM